MSVTSLQRRANDRRRFWIGYHEWLEGALARDGITGKVARREIVERGTARVMWGAEIRYRRLGRRSAAYRMKGAS